MASTRRDRARLTDQGRQGQRRRVRGAGRRLAGFYRGSRTPSVKAATTICSSRVGRRAECCSGCALICDNVTFAVVSLNLSNLNLGGEISPAIGDLKSLQYTGLRGNSLTGTLSPDMCQLASDTLMSGGTTLLALFLIALVTAQVLRSQTSLTTKLPGKLHTTLVSCKLPPYLSKEIDLQGRFQRLLL